MALLVRSGRLPRPFPAVVPSAVLFTSFNFPQGTEAGMAEAQRKRWAAVREESTAPAEAPQPKRKLSAAGRRKIAEAAKKRWAAAREAKAAPAKSAPRKTPSKRAARKASPETKARAATRPSAAPEPTATQAAE